MKKKNVSKTWIFREVEEKVNFIFILVQITNWAKSFVPRGFEGKLVLSLTRPNFLTGWSCKLGSRPRCQLPLITPFSMSHDKFLVSY